MIQETWRFEKEEFDLHGCKIIHAGLAHPPASTPRRRGRPGKEGVAIILGKIATEAWNNSNNFLYSHDARIISARLVFPSENLRDKPISIYIVSAYAPTSNASNTTITAYLDELRTCINKKEQHDILIIGSDTNSSMGIKTSSNSQSTNSVDSIGSYGLTDKNAAGIRFLSFLQSEDLVAMSTYFQKPPIKYQTWIHPRSKTPYQIDHIITNKESFNLFKDVTTTEHLVDSDHYPVMAKLETKQAHNKHRPSNN